MTDRRSGRWPRNPSFPPSARTSDAVQRCSWRRSFIQPWPAVKSFWTRASRGGCLLGGGSLGLFFALGGFGRILALGHVVGLLLGGGGPLLGSMCSGALPLFGGGPRFLDLTFFRCARAFLVLDRVVALGLQFVVGLRLFLGRCRLELGRTVRHITAFDARTTALLQLRVAQQVADGRVQPSQPALIDQSWRRF